MSGVGKRIGGNGDGAEQGGCEREVGEAEGEGGERGGLELASRGACTVEPQGLDGAAASRANIEAQALPMEGCERGVVSS